MDTITRQDQYFDAMSGGSSEIPEPITRKEQFYAKMAGDESIETPEPVTREEYWLHKIIEHGGGGSTTIEELNVTENGTYSETGKAYSPVKVNVPNPSTGTLNITENGTYDVTEKASAVVDVSGGGLELLAEQSLGDIATSSTSETTVGTQFEVPIDGIYNYIFIVAKANTAKASHHGATVAIFAKSGNASRLYTPHVNYVFNSSGSLVALTNPTGTVSYGIYPSVSASMVKLNITMKAKYHSSYTQTIDNNYTVYVYGVKEADLLR